MTSEETMGQKLSMSANEENELMNLFLRGQNQQSARINPPARMRMMAPTVFGLQQRAMVSPGKQVDYRRKRT